MASRLSELVWDRRLIRGEEWVAVFTAPGLCPYWDNTWAGITLFAERKVCLDPRPSVHGKGGYSETALHEWCHVVRGPHRDLRYDEPFIRSLSPTLHDVIRPEFPPLPAGLPALRRKVYRYLAKHRIDDEE